MDKYSKIKIFMFSFIDYLLQAHFGETWEWNIYSNNIVGNHTSRFYFKHQNLYTKYISKNCTMCFGFSGSFAVQNLCRGICDNESKCLLDDAI